MTCRITRLVVNNISSQDAATRVQKAASFMAAHDLGSILVTEAGRVVGLFTERDLLKRIVGVEQDPRKLTLGEVCSRNLISISHDSTCKEAIRLMRSNNCRRLLVYRNDDLLGLINISSVAHAMTEQHGLKNMLVNLVGGLTLTFVLLVIVMLIAVLPDMLDMAEQAIR